MRCANHYILFLFTFYTFSHIGVVTGLCFSSFQLLFSDWLVYRENLISPSYLDLLHIKLSISFEH